MCRFRHLLETHNLGQRLFDVQHQLATKGGHRHDRRSHIINAPSSTKNADKARDPEMHQTKKGNQWYFEMKDNNTLFSSRLHLDTTLGGTDQWPNPRLGTVSERQDYAATYTQILRAIEPSIT